ncbi:leucine-rich repeat domain-containing protein [Flavobacterium limi]|uniref:Leucine rich repeat-containing protein n=1 Tax=Flavobacterium limi TaxID=2045105 RepID=A0ABQ1UPF5_9FLAO|nr:hypothetical protein [Flavobacterium limi]GGF23352.1 hypothetical protein GCM10011518_35820 [Flavobacterium limi]
MKELTLTSISSLPQDILAQTDLEKLTISNSALAIPGSIANFQQLKELRFVGNTNLYLPVEILGLSKTFILFERNTPEHIQLAGQVIFEFQRKKITEPQAKVFLMLLQEQDFDAVAEKEHVIAALDYRIKEIQSKALEKLNEIFPMTETLSENNIVCIVGNTEAFAETDIKPRLKKLNINLQNKISQNATLVVLAKEPKLKLPINDVLITTEDNFYQWINKADKLLLSEKTEANAQAITNVAAMLNSANPANVALALQMMKTNGVSNELLGELLIFINSSKDKTAIRTAKSLFKKFGPKEFITFLEARNHRYYKLLEFYSGDESVYNWLDQHTAIDSLPIVQKLYPALYAKRSKGQQRIDFISKMITNDTLDLSSWGLDEFPDEIGQFDTLKALYFVDSKGNSRNRLQKFPDFITSLVHLEKLDLFGVYLSGSLPESISNLNSLKYLGLPVCDNFPEVINTLTSLEVLEIDLNQLKELPRLQNLIQLKQVIVTEYFFDSEKAEAETLWEQKKAFLPSSCQVIFQKSHKRWSE